MNLDPDIVTLGKIVGGGFPIGVICGKGELMNISDTSSHTKSERAYIGGGTFSANPLTMTAGRSMLGFLKKNPSIYRKISRLGDTVRREMDRTFDGKVLTTGKGSLFMTHFLANGITEVKSASDAARCDTGLLQRYHFDLIARDGIFFLPGKLGAISNAHNESDIKKLVQASSRFSASM